MECAFFGCYKGRWARTVRALNLGREFNDPFEGIGRKGHEVGDEVLCLCKSFLLPVGLPDLKSQIQSSVCNEDCSFKSSKSIFLIGHIVASRSAAWPYSTDPYLIVGAMPPSVDVWDVRAEANVNSVIAKTKVNMQQ